MEIAGFVTGVIALIISGFIAWNNYISRVNIKIICGNPRIEPVFLKEGNGDAAILFSAIFPLYFINLGAQDGVIRNIIIIVKSDQKQWLCKSAFYTAYNIQKESTLGRKLTEDPSNEPFYPVYLSGKSKIYKPIAFVPMKTDEFPIDTSPLLAGKYNFEIRTLEANKKDYKTKIVSSITLNEEQIKDLSGEANIIPSLKEVED
jgi:hypothetical protein